MRNRTLNHKSWFINTIMALAMMLGILCLSSMAATSASATGNQVVVGTTETLVNTPNHHVHRTVVAVDAKGNATYAIDDITARSKTVYRDGTIVTQSPKGTVVTKPPATVGAKHDSPVGGGTPTYAGCTTVTMYYNRTTQFIFIRQTIYTVHLSVRWCFIADHIGQDGHGHAQTTRGWGFSNLVSNSEPFGSLSWAGGEYWDAMPGRAADSSYHIRASQGWHQCFPALGCNATEYPYIWVDIHGNSTYVFDAGH